MLRFKLAIHRLHRWRKEIYASTFATVDNIYDARYVCIELLLSAQYLPVICIICYLLIYIHIIVLYYHFDRKLRSQSTVFCKLSHPSLCLCRYMHNIQMLQRAAQNGLPVAVATQSMTDDAERSAHCSVTELIGLMIGFRS